MRVVVVGFPPIDRILAWNGTTTAVERSGSTGSSSLLAPRAVAGVPSGRGEGSRTGLNEGAIALIDEWLAADWEDDSGELDALKRDLDENRSSDRKLFP